MGRKLFTLGLLLAVSLLASCIRDEALNTEADIEACTLDGNVLEYSEITNDKVILYLKKGTDRTALAPKFVLTAGARIIPESGTVRNFNLPQIYKVISEDGAWEKNYIIKAINSANNTNDFHFEDVRMNKTGKYQIFFDANPMTGERVDWGSGNAGFALTGVGKTELDYPTYQHEQGYVGKCLALTTRRTGSFGEMADMPIAAGNLFIGSFDVKNALTNSLKATKFGVPWERVPVAVSGWYKFRSGDKFYERDLTAPHKMKEVPNRRDQFNIYAVFYESTEDMPTLDGTNYMDEQNPNIILTALIDQKDAVETEQWTAFRIPFVLRSGKKVDPEKLAQGRYNLALVFTSSKDGDKFSGAPDTTLLIDEVILEYGDADEK